MKKYLLLCFVIGSIAACTNEKPESTSESTEISPEQQAEIDRIKRESDSIEASIYKWQYSESKDEMTEKTNYTATVLSSDIASLDFPYEGGTSMKLFIRDKNGSKDAFIRCENGQITDDYDYKTLTLKFDDEKSVIYEVSESSDHDSEYRFFVSANKLIKKLKTAKKLKIQVEFYNNGIHVYNFDVSDLKFDH